MYAYTLLDQMLNIHERQKCGIPVIIEGETGVGKTALLIMLSKLWNHALRKQWKIEKGRLLQQLHEKSKGVHVFIAFIILSCHNWNLGLEGNLQDILAESVIEYNVMFTETDILPLLEMMHPSAAGSDNEIKYYVYLNNYLLQLVHSQTLFKLLEFKPEKTLDDIRSVPDSMFVVDRMILTAIEENSSEVIIALKLYTMCSFYACVGNCPILMSFAECNPD